MDENGEKGFLLCLLALGCGLIFIGMVLL